MIPGMKFIPRPTEEDMAVLDDELLLCPGGRMRLRCAEDLLTLGIERLQAWCNLRARYTLVTAELVDFLQVKIGRRSALEIGAGQGDLGYHLGIRQTDLGLQAPAFNMGLLALLEQTPTDPPDDIERIDAEAAVEKYDPEVVLGSWITQRYHEIANYGVEEVRVLAGRQYIHVGNDRPHAGKRILRLSHKTFYRDWLLSRAFDQKKNCIRIWGE